MGEFPLGQYRFKKLLVFLIKVMVTVVLNQAGTGSVWVGRFVFTIGLTQMFVSVMKKEDKWYQSSYFCVKADKTQVLKNKAKTQWCYKCSTFRKDFVF